MLRNSTPVPGPYAVGDIVSYCRNPRAGGSGIQWSVGSRIVGFEIDNENPDKEPNTCWVICDGIPICVSTDKIRPCTSPELLAYHYMMMQNPDTVPTTVHGTNQQQSYVDARPHAPPVVEIPPVSDPMPEDEDEEGVMGCRCPWSAFIIVMPQSFCAWMDEMGRMAKASRS